MGKTIVKNVEPIKKTEEKLEPILTEDGEAKWLIITKKKVFNENRPIKEIITDPLEPEIEPVFELRDQCIWECLKCGNLIKSNPSPPVECYKDLGGCGRKSDFKMVTDEIVPLWSLPVWKDIPVEDLDMQNTYLDLKKLLKSTLIFQEAIQYDLFALWIISTYKVERWNAIPFLIFRGLISSGKTQALELAGKLGYRLMLATGASFPAIVRASHEYNAGLLIDEIDNKIDKRTENGRNYIDFLKPSYKRGQHYFTADLNNQRKIQQYRNFGFKAFAGEKGGYDQAMFSRAIDFQMEQDYPEIYNLDKVKDEINRIKTILLNYRYKTDEPPQIDDEIRLKGRNREIFECIIATAMHIGIKHDNIIEYVEDVEKEKIEDFKSTVEWEILNAIKNYENAETLDDAPEIIDFKELADRLDWDYDRSTGQKLGYIIRKKFFLKTKRRKQGTVLLLNHKKNIRKLNYLYKRYKI